MGNQQTTAQQLKKLVSDDSKTVNKKYKALFNRYDKDHNGTIDQDEAVRFVDDFMTVVELEIDEANAALVGEAIFEVCDTNQDGVLSKEEFQLALWKIDEIHHLFNVKVGAETIDTPDMAGLLDSEVSYLRGDDGFYHPSTEDEIISLVQFAHDHDLQLRVRGASHSDSSLIYTDTVAQEYPYGWNMIKKLNVPLNEMNLILDRYDKIVSVNTDTKIAVVQGGIHLGADPENPEGAGGPVPYEDSLLWQLHYNYGLSVEETGGITHQSIAGFISTGSSGGSLRYAIDQNIAALRIVGIVNGRATAIDYTKDSEEYPFSGAVVSVGLLGVISTVTLQCNDTFRVYGREVYATVDHTAKNGAEFDMFNQESLEAWFKKYDYSRCMWWPQNHNDRLICWQAMRNDDPIPDGWDKPTKKKDHKKDIKKDPNDEALKEGPRRLYYEFDPNQPMLPGLLELFLSIIGCIMYGGELRLEEADEAVLARGLEMIEGERDEAPDQNALEKLVYSISKAIAKAGAGMIAYLSRKIAQWRDIFKPLVPFLMKIARSVFYPLGGIQRFNDYCWHGLPMDNTAPDDKLPMWFSEIWVPLARGADLLRLLNDYFDGGNSSEDLYKTGLFSWEIYCTPATESWMHMGYSNGNDIWKDGCLRVDMIWFGKNQGQPKDLYQQHWDHIKASGIPFRLHWGKDFPDPNADWIAYWKDKWEKWDDFLALRAKVDPKGIFLTKRWASLLDIQ
eukprot:TRINITY_DN2587_c0_g1_i1.p1 TRINITY_DN2587_c0_g1~~TRINITY_DN2587_c0_g1_i1.p1  ORF type:complete len:731 (+),score=197.02 TRINITY_DN2587_c0_g1_i1:420-2612(+)